MSSTPSFRRWPVHAIALATVLPLSGCGGGGGDSDPAPATPAAVAPPRAVTQSDLEIAQLLYAGTPRTPADFQPDAPPTGHTHASTVHLKNTDIDATLSAPHPQFELCTDDWNQALEWSETHAQQSTQYADLVATDDGARYFEFGRSRSGDPDFYLRERVFKCAYLDRNTANLREPEGDAGQINQRPLTATELKSLGEYLWQFTRYNNFGSAVLDSRTATSAVSLSHTLVIADLARGGQSATCDRIDVISWRHTVDTNTGALTLDVETLWSFGAKESAGTASLCN